MDTTTDVRFDRLSRNVVISGIAAALAYLAFSLYVGWRDVAEAVVRIGAAGLSAALALSALNYGLRFVRWQMYLRKLGLLIPAGPSALIYLSGFAFTTTPGKAGELLRGTFLHRRGTPYLKSTAAFISERLSDLVAVLALSLPGFMLMPMQVVVSVAVVAICGILAITRLIRSGVASRFLLWCERRVGRFGFLLQHTRRLLMEAKSCHTPGTFFKATILSVFAWGAEALAFALILHLLGIAVPIPLAVFIYSAAMLAGALSFLPGGLGGAEATMIALLAFNGASYPESVAATIVIRLTTLWFAVALGILLTIVGRRTLLAPAVGPA